MKFKNRPVIAALLCAILFLHTASVAQVRAEDLLRWQIVTPEGVSLGVVEGLASVYTNRVIYYDPFGVSPNRCVNGCTFVLDSYQNVQGTTVPNMPSTSLNGAKMVCQNLFAIAPRGQLLYSGNDSISLEECDRNARSIASTSSSYSDANQKMKRIYFSNFDFWCWGRNNCVTEEDM